MTVAASTNSVWFSREWQTEDGLPNNNVYGIAQTYDGFLWVATSAGLARFDGVRFEEISSTNFSHQASFGVVAISRSRTGGLLLGMDRGAIVQLNAEKTEVNLPTNGLPDLIAQTLIHEDDGTIWISYLGGAVCSLKNGQPTVLTAQQGLPWGPFSSVTRDVKGQIWLSRAGNVGIFRDGHFQSVHDFANGSIRVAAARDGGVWASVGSRLFHVDLDGSLKEIGRLPTGNPQIEPSAVLEDSRGAVWIGTTYDGLFCYTDDHFERITTSHSEISSLLEDSEGDIWVGTHGGGLDRLRPRTVALESVKTGLPFEAVQSVCEETNGTLWAVTENGLLVRKDPDGWSTVSTNAEWSGNTITCVASAPDGGVWVGTRNRRLLRWRDGQLTIWSRTQGLEASPITALLVSRTGNLWIGGLNHTLQVFRHGEFADVSLPDDSRTVRAIVEDASGEVWIGTSKGLLFRMEGDKAVDETEKTTNGYKSIRCLFPGPDGSLWIGYAGAGLGRFKEGRYTRVTTSEGLFDNYISQVINDGHGWFWFGADRGIFKVRQDELEAAAENPIGARIRSIHYGRGEGLPSLQAAFGYVPNNARGRDGRMLIATRSALAVVDPEKFTESSRPPPLLLKRVALDEKTVATYGGIVSVSGAADLRKRVVLLVPPNHRKLEFEFAALSFRAPENVRLQYQLEGFDGDWIDADAQHSATYSRLSAGNYCFRVRASDSGGTWSDARIAFVFTVTPFVWQRWWFLPVGLGLFALAVIVIVRYVSFRRLRSRLRALEQQAALDKERARIARDLHDDLGSHLTKIVLLSDLMLDGHKEPEKSGETAKRVSSTARQVIKSLDETVWAVNPRNDNLPQLVDYIGQFAVEFLRMAGIRCNADLPMKVPQKNVSTEVRHNLFLVVKEALNNIVSHSGAKEASLRIVIDDPWLRLTIEDNGRGFNGAPDNGSADGLRNMRQRVEEIGGRFDLESNLASGTRITVAAPLVMNKYRN